MSYFDPEYEPSELDGEVFLSQAPLTLLMQAIETQFEMPGEYQRKDYVQSFISKYEHCRNLQDEETKEELDGYYGAFVRFMEELLHQYLSVGFPELENLPDDDALDLIHMTYRFFIKNIKKNFMRLVINYVDQHKDMLVEELEERRDITFLNFKGQIDDDGDVLILSNLSAVVQEVLSCDFSVDEFLELVNDGDFLECDFVADKYEEFEITGNFVPNYIKMVDTDLQLSLETKLRNTILKKYGDRKRLKKIIKQGESEENTEDE